MGGAASNAIVGHHGGRTDSFTRHAYNSEAGTDW